MHVTPTPGTVLVKWQDSSRCVATFIIERSTEKDGTYERVNGADTVWLSLLTPNGAAVPEAGSPGEMFGSEGEALPAHVFRPQLGRLKRFR